MQGARVTFADVVPANQEILRRVLRSKNLLTPRVGKDGVVEGEAPTQLVLFDSLASLDAALAAATAPLRPGGPPRLFDAVFACGSLHHLPRELITAEMAVILPYVRRGGRWIQLAYPLARWTQWPAVLGGASPKFGRGGFGMVRCCLLSFSSLSTKERRGGLTLSASPPIAFHCALCAGGWPRNTVGRVVQSRQADANPRSRSRCDRVHRRCTKRRVPGGRRGAHGACRIDSAWR